jgi:hypothetical protein
MKGESYYADKCAVLEKRNDDLAYEVKKLKILVEKMQVSEYAAKREVAETKKAAAEVIAATKEVAVAAVAEAEGRAKKSFQAARQSVAEEVRAKTEAVRESCERQRRELQQEKLVVAARAIEIGKKREANKEEVRFYKTILHANKILPSSDGRYLISGRMVNLDEFSELRRGEGGSWP